MQEESQGVSVSALDFLMRQEQLLTEPGAAATLAFLLVGGGVAYGIHRHFAARARVLPYIPALSEAVDGEHDETTRFLAAVHEMTMAVTDAWNATRARKVGRTSVEAVIRADVLVPACEGVQAGADAVRERFDDFRVLAEVALGAAGALGDAWQYDNRHNYRTEIYTVTTTDADGETQTETRTREVYEDTDHYFTFNMGSAEEAQARIADLLRERAGRQMSLPDVQRLRVRVDRMDEVQRMFVGRMVRDTILEDGKAAVSDGDIAQAANQWILGARVDDWLQAVIAGAERVDATHGNEMTRVLSSEASYHYCTTSRTHDGPPGFQAARSLGTTLSGLAAGWDSMQSMLRLCEDVARDLVSWAEDRSEEESDTDYVKRAAAAYEAAFPESTLEIDQLPRHGWTVGIGLLAGTAAAAILYFGLGGTF
ncbi:MAG: hypothetical protein VX265_09900 [Myxococcota bacterium]|nr:hypothetical protein [Myxococcota bacterium]